MGSRLVAIAGPFQGAEFPIDKPEVSIGRDRSNDICLDDLAVSRQHALISCDETVVRVTDRGSRNPVTVNGMPVTDRPLNHGDQIRIGRSLLLVDLHPGDAAPVAPAVVFDDAPPTLATVVLNQKDARYVSAAALADACPPRDDRTRGLQCLLRVSEAVAGRHTLDELAARVLALAASEIPAQRAALLLGNPATDEWSSQYSWVAPAALAQAVHVPRSVIRRVVEDRVSIGSSDVAADRSLGSAPSVVATRAQSLVAVPVVLAGDVLGAIYMDSANALRPLDGEDLQLLTGIAAMAAGALDGARRLDRMAAENQRLKAESNVQHELVGDSPRMQAVYRLVARVAPADTTVLIEGESGTGKELVARAIHRNSRRAAGPFVAINCATLGEALVESELFGHEKGAFTGAIALKRGKLEEAQKGTVFLDEIGELAPAVQARLLRVLQQREFERVGGTRAIKADVRIVAATNRVLKNEVQSGTFREDLFFRINVVSIVLPALRDRREDIPSLVRAFIGKHALKSGRRVTACSAEALACLQRYDWPGNVRELENAIERALVLGAADTILPDDLPESVLDTAQTDHEGTRFHDRIRRVKRELVIEAMQRANDNYTEAARVLGLHPNNLHRLMRNLGLRTPTP